MEYKKYRRTQIAEMADWAPGFNMTGVSVAEVDQRARNPANHADKWLIAAAYFEANFEPIEQGG